MFSFAAEFPEIRRLFLVEKTVHHMKHDPVFLLAFEVNKWHDNVEVDEQKWISRVSTSFANEFPWLNRPFSALVEKDGAWDQHLPGIEGALIHQGTGKSKRTLWGKIKFGYWILIAIVLVGFVIAKLTGWM